VADGGAGRRRVLRPAQVATLVRVNEPTSRSRTGWSRFRQPTCAIWSCTGNASSNRCAVSASLVRGEIAACACITSTLRADPAARGFAARSSHHPTCSTTPMPALVRMVSRRAATASADNQSQNCNPRPKGSVCHPRQRYPNGYRFARNRSERLNVARLSAPAAAATPDIPRRRCAAFVRGRG
jgi:hypothetical protein